MKELLYRVVEARVIRQLRGFRVEAWLLIQGKGRAVHFDIPAIADLPIELGKAVSVAYQQVTGSSLPDTAL